MEHEKLREIAVKILNELWYCTRDQSAWQYGTMSRSDFIPADEDEDIINDVIDLLEKNIKDSDIDPRIQGLIKELDECNRQRRMANLKLREIGLALKLPLIASVDDILTEVKKRER